MAAGKSNKRPALPVDKGSLRVLAIGCVLIVTVMLLMSLSSIQIIKQAVVTKLKTNDLVNLSQSYSAVIEEKIDRAVDASLLLSYDPDVIGWINSGESGDRLGQDVKAKMETLVNGFGYETAFLTSNKTYHYWSYHDDQFLLLNTVSKDNPGDAWFFSTLEMEKKYAINIDYNAGLNKTYVWINVLVGDIDSPIAVTGLGMNLGSVIRELIAENMERRSEYNIWLVNREGQIRLATDAKDLNRNVGELLPAMLAERLTYNGGGDFVIDEYGTSKGQLYDIAYRQIKDTDWKLIIQIPRSETTGFLSSVTWNIVQYGIGIILIVLVLFLFLSNRIANPYKRAIKLNQELEQIVALRTSELKERNEKIQDSIDYARSIQQTIFPSQRELNQVLKQYFVLFQPKDAVGGDFYWVKRVASGRLLIVGDCTGHGVAGALMTTAVNAMLNQITEQISDDPARFLEALHRRIREFAREDSAALMTPYGLDAAVLYIDDDGTILYSGAALAAYIWDGAAITEVPGSSATIDSMVRRREKHFENHALTHSTDMTVYISTDGFIEQPGGQKGLPFGKTRFKSLLSQIALLPVHQQQAAMLQALLDYQDGTQRRDDVTVLGFRLEINGG